MNLISTKVTNGIDKWVAQTMTFGQTDKQSIYYAGKRIFDLVVIMTALLLLSPLLLVIVIAIKIDSPGPIIFVQERVGCKRRKRNGQAVWEIVNFPIYKFRSMTTDADESIHAEHIKAYVNGTLEESDNENARFKLSNDSRITRVGSFLRRTSLDELPQIFNILIGNMSLVGPRPVPVYEVSEYKSWHYERLTALPGITGEWQVYGRGQVDFDSQIQMDIDYVHNQSLAYDFKLILKTVPAVLSGRGAE